MYWKLFQNSWYRMKKRLCSIHHSKTTNFLNHFLVPWYCYLVICLRMCHSVIHHFLFFLIFLLTIFLAHSVLNKTPSHKYVLYTENTFQRHPWPPELLFSLIRKIQIDYKQHKSKTVQYWYAFPTYMTITITLINVS